MAINIAERASKNSGEVYQIDGGTRLNECDRAIEGRKIVNFWKRLNLISDRMAKWICARVYATGYFCCSIRCFDDDEPKKKHRTKFKYKCAHSLTLSKYTCVSMCFYIYTIYKYRYTLCMPTCRIDILYILHWFMCKIEYAHRSHVYRRKLCRCMRNECRE